MFKGLNLIYFFRLQVRKIEISLPFQTGNDIEAVSQSRRRRAQDSRKGENKKPKGNTLRHGTETRGKRGSD